MIYNNQNLFSNHFLRYGLPDTFEWRTPIPKAIFDNLCKLYESEKANLVGMNESQLEDHFLRKVFGFLEFEYETKECIKESGDFPDYIMFNNRRDADDALQGIVDFFKNSIGIAEVKSWDKPLDRFGKDRKNQQRNPSFQIWFYLQTTKKEWGILTNGRLWRLYHHDSSFDTFFEIDLISIIEHNDVEAFRYFYYFFRKDAFISKGTKSSFLGEVLKGSQEYAKAVGENLKENVYKTLNIIAQGFIDYRENGLNIQNNNDLELVHHNSMHLLYRLLFIFFAEGKGLLNEQSYYDSKYSLHRLKHEIAKEKDADNAILPVSTSYWNTLQNLFKLINLGSEACNINKKEFYLPPYNGGLFDPEKNPFLEEKRIGDNALADAIDLLSRATLSDNKVGFVDYSTLDIRHLGGIYEGLLEYRLSVAGERMVATRGKKAVWMPYSNYLSERKKPKRFEDFPAEDKAEIGKLYLKTDKGARKATGSYYTPEYIVRHIVEESIGPVADEYLLEAKSKGESFANTILRIKVIDPAMGSGHFLVGATEYLSARLLKAVEQDVESGHLSETEAVKCTADWAKREIVSHCIFGVDLNDLAVELAKVSLWLTTVSKDRPLSFLDHHLKCGNSLIGGRIIDIAWLPGDRPRKMETKIDEQFGLLKGIKSKLKELEAISDNSVKDIKEKEKLYQKLISSDDYQRIRILADLHVGLYFNDSNLDLIHDRYMDLANESLRGSKKKWEWKSKESWLQEPLRIARGLRSFHWELEFPEAFVGESDDNAISGFDVMIGNPPYVRMELIKDLKPYLERVYYSYTGRADIYVYFLEKFTKILRENGYGSYIVSNKFFKVKYGSKIRKLLSESCSIREVVNFEDLPVFEDVTAYVAIVSLVNSKPLPNSKMKYTVVPNLDFESVREVVDSNKRECALENIDASEWNFLTPEERRLLAKLSVDSRQLSEITESPTVGIKTALNEVYIMKSEDVKKILAGSNQEEDLFRNCVFGSDIDSYLVKNNDLKILFPYVRDHNGEWEPISLMNYPRVKTYLESNRAQLEKRAIIKDELDERDSRWYEFQQINASLDFDRPLLVYRDLAESSCFAMTKGGEIIDMTAFVLPDDSDYLLALLNSKLTLWVIGLMCARARGGWYRFKTQYIDRLPIKTVRSINDSNVQKKIFDQIESLVGMNSNKGRLARANDFCSASKDKSETQDRIACGLEKMADISMNLREKREVEIAQFIKWLQIWTSSEIENWDNKTKIMYFYNFDINTLVDVMKKNQSIIRIDILKKDHVLRFSAEYESSKAKINEFDNRIDDLSRLMDLFAYHLYDLTPDEIALIESTDKTEVEKKYGF
jgi:hypothetical protein